MRLAAVAEVFRRLRDANPTPTTELEFASPFQLFKILANMAGIVLLVAGVQIFLVNRRFLPPAVRPPLWREVGLLLCSAFYAFFAFFVIRDLVRSMW